MKLKLKHLAPYLPYGLKFVVEISEFAKKELGNTAPYENREFTLGNNLDLCLKYGKPILRPLSDLLKDEFLEIYDSLNYTDKTNLLLKSENRCEAVNSFRYYEFVKLLENHFDVFGLIENGLAIDINTL